MFFFKGTKLVQIALYLSKCIKMSQQISTIVKTDPIASSNVQMGQSESHLGQMGHIRSE